MHEGHRSRLRERAAKYGLDSLETHELLELFLYAYIPRKDTNPIAHDLLDTFGSISKVLDADAEDLVQITNMTKRAAIALNSVPQLIKRYLNDKNMPKKNLSTIKNAVEYLQNETKFLTKERFYILCLDIHYNLKKSVIINSDQVDRVNIAMKDIHVAVLRHKTKSIIIAHNHPSGGILPSDEDISLTRDIIMSMSYLEVEILDHIIVTETNHFSFREKGLLYEILINNDNKALKTAAKKYKIGEKDES